MSTAGPGHSLDRLKREATGAKKAFDQAENKDQFTDSTPALHCALSDWIESRLPTDKGLLTVQLNLESKLGAELRDAGLSVPDPSPDADPFDGPAFGYFEVTLTQLPELPDTLLLTAGVSIPCGVDDAVYLYRFDSESRHRLIEEHPETGYGSIVFDLAPPDPQGRRLLLIHRVTQQCAHLDGHDLLRLQGSHTSPVLPSVCSRFSTVSG